MTLLHHLCAIVTYLLRGSEARARCIIFAFARRSIPAFICPNRTPHGGPRRGGHCAGRVLIHVMNLLPARAKDVCDVGVVDVCVRDVDVAYIALTDPVARHINFAWRQREPTHPVVPTTERMRATGPASYPSHESWRIHRSQMPRSGNPAPAGAQIRPTAVMERRETPRLPIHPRPTPGRNPHPTPKTVRRPTGVDPPRVPHVAVAHV
jgi:hypothetical protein